MSTTVTGDGAEERLNAIRAFLKRGDHTIAAKEALGLLEISLRQMFHSNIGQLPGAARRQVMEVESKISGPDRGVEVFTLGELVRLFRESDFLRHWANTTSSELRGIRFINLDEIARLRNTLVHSGSDASRSEAELVVQALQTVLETFGVLTLDSAVAGERPVPPVEQSPATTPRSRRGTRAASGYTPDAAEEVARLEFQRRLFLEFDEHMAARACGRLNSGQGLTVLDVGCADGSQVMPTWGKRPDVRLLVGIDSSATAIERAQVAHGNDDETRQFIRADIETEFEGLLADAAPRDGFDLVVLTATLQHLGDPVRALRKLRGLLAPGGGILARAPDDDLMLAHPDQDERLHRILQLSRQLPGASDRTAGRKVHHWLYRAGFRDLDANLVSFVTTGRTREERHQMFETFFTHRRLSLERALAARPDDNELRHMGDELLDLLAELELDFEDESHFFSYSEVGILAWR